MNATLDLRKTYYLILTTVAVAVAAAKVCGVENVYEPSRFTPTPGSYGEGRIDESLRKWPEKRPEPTPTFGSNDRSRWATMVALVDHGTFVIGHREVYDDPKTDRGLIFDNLSEWRTIDVVMNPATQDYYSSKPPLFAVMLAGEYWLLKKAFGWSFEPDRWKVICTILITVNVIPFFISLLLMAKLIETHGSSDFGKLLAFTIYAVATFATTFSNALNNHTPAIFCVVFTLYPLLKSSEAPSKLALLMAGVFAAFTATFDLPAASFAAAILFLTLLKCRLHTIWMLLGMLIPAAAFFVCNYWALNRFTPAYSEFGGPWYDFPGSHWAKLQDAKNGKIIPGIDYAQEPRKTYLFHCLLGHHGWFSLTPVWLVGLLGCFAYFAKALRNCLRDSLSFPVIVQLAWVLTTVLTLFFVYYQKTNNYGGGTSGLRWFFWTTPLWVLATLAGADKVAPVKWCRVVVAMLLFFSVFSVFYPAWNPWRNPWIQVLMERLEWVNYERVR